MLSHADDPTIPEAGFASVEAAREYAINALPMDGVEWGNGVIRYEGGYYPTSAVTQNLVDAVDFAFAIPKGAVIVEFNHTHPPGPGVDPRRFWNTDVATAHRLSRTHGVERAFIKTYDGAVRMYVPRGPMPTNTFGQPLDQPGKLCARFPQC